MYQYKTIIKRVIDGDTVVVDVDLGFFTWLRDLPIRLHGIDTPERTDKHGWEAAKAFTENFFKENPTAILNVSGQDKYGRWLGEFLDPQSGTLNKQLVSLGLAKWYYP